MVEELVEELPQLKGIIGPQEQVGELPQLRGIKGPQELVEELPQLKGIKGPQEQGLRFPAGNTGGEEMMIVTIETMQTWILGSSTGDRILTLIFWICCLTHRG